MHAHLRYPAGRHPISRTQGHRHRHLPRVRSLFDRHRPRRRYPIQQNRRPGLTTLIARAIPILHFHHLLAISPAQPQGLTITVRLPIPPRFSGLMHAHLRYPAGRHPISRTQGHRHRHLPRVRSLHDRHRPRRRYPIQKNCTRIRATDIF